MTLTTCSLKLLSSSRPTTHTLNASGRLEGMYIYIYMYIVSTVSFGVYIYSTSIDNKYKIIYGKPLYVMVKKKNMVSR